MIFDGIVGKRSVTFGMDTLIFWKGELLVFFGGWVGYISHHRRFSIHGQVALQVLVDNRKNFSKGSYFLHSQDSSSDLYVKQNY